MLVDARRIVVRPGGRVGVVLAVERHALLVVRVPTDALVSPACREQRVAFDRARRVVVIAGIGVVESVHRRVRALRCRPARTLVVPTGAYEHVALGRAGRVEVLAAVGVIEALHGYARIGFRRL